MANITGPASWLSRRDFMHGAAAISMGCVGVAFSGCGRQPSATGRAQITLGDASAVAVGWPFYIASRRGFFAQERLEVEFLFSGSAPAVAQQLLAGAFDLGITTTELLIRAVAARAPLVLIGNAVRGYPYSVMASSEVAKPADLRRRKVMMAAPKSAQTILWNAWLRRNGVEPREVDLLFDGSSVNRFAALSNGAVSAAILTQPLDLVATQRGFRSLLDINAEAGAVGFTSIVARRSWLEDHAEKARAFLRAVAEGIRYFYDPANRAAAIAILVQDTRTDPAIAPHVYEYYARELQPFPVDLDLPDEKIAATIALLKTAGELKAGEYPASRFIDRSFLPRQRV